MRISDWSSDVCSSDLAAREHSRSVIVETFQPGDDHRLLVINGELIAATKRTPGHVVGDGTHTIAELVEAVNQDPRRGVGHEKVLTRLELDAQRSEEHTSELQSLMRISYAVFCLKKKTHKINMMR